MTVKQTTTQHRNGLKITRLPERTKPRRQPMMAHAAAPINKRLVQPLRLEDGVDLDDRYIPPQRDGLSRASYRKGLPC
jgi:hypothetical protein